MDIAKSQRITKSGRKLWLVPSQSKDGTYVVDPAEGSCTCPDHETRSTSPYVGQVPCDGGRRDLPLCRTIMNETYPPAPIAHIKDTDIEKALERLKRQLTFSVSQSENTSLPRVADRNLRNASQPVILAATASVTIATLLALTFKGSVSFAMVSVFFSGVIGFAVAFLSTERLTRTARMIDDSKILG